MLNQSFKRMQVQRYKIMGYVINKSYKMIKKYPISK